jgi:hypothetical protein
MVFLRFALLLVVAGAVVAAAGAETKPSLEGVYTTKLAGTPVALLNATWRVQITPDHHYVIFRNGARVVSGSWVKIVHFGYYIGPPTVGFRDRSGLAACPGKTARATYTWRLKQSAAGRTYLVFKSVGDSCAGRKAVLTTRPLLKIK